MATQNVCDNDINVNSPHSIEITTAGQLSLTSTQNSGDSVNIISNGGTNEYIYISSFQGTANWSVWLESQSGGILLDAPAMISLQSSDSVELQWNNESAGVTLHDANSNVYANILVGQGTPQGAVTPNNKGSIYIDVNGGGTNNLYTNSDGTNTGWYNIVGTKDPGGAGFTWQVNSSAAAGPFTLVPNNGYFANDSTTTIQYNLPLTANVGDTYSVFSVTGVALSPTWSINQNAGQTIQYQSLYATTGVGHGIQTFNNSNGVGLTLVCTAANTDWIITSTQGTSFALF